MTKSAGAAAVVVAVADVATDAVAAPAEVARHASRISRLTVAVGILAVIALVAALYWARAFFVPLLIGILASYALSPVVDWLKTHRVPRPVAAALVLAVVIGGLSWVGFSLQNQATTMIEKLPDAARKLRQTLSDARTSQGVCTYAYIERTITSPALFAQAYSALRPLITRTSTTMIAMTSSA